MLPDLDAARSPRLWVLSDTFAQPGLLLFRHLLRRTKRHIALVCLETDPDKLLEGSEANKVDCYDGWSTCEEFDLVAPLRSSPRKYVQLSSARKLPVELLAGLEGHPADVFVDSASALFETFSLSTAITLLRNIIDSIAPHGRLILLHHTDALPLDPHQSSLESLLLSPSLSSSLFHLTIHPSTLPTFLASAYSIPPSDLRTHDYLHKLHLRGWSGVAYDYSDHTATIEAGTKFDALGAGGEACISWFKRMVAGGKVERGICGVKLKQGELIWEELPEVKVEYVKVAEPALEDVRTQAQQAARDEVKLPFTPGGSGGPAVVYEADSGDDFDEDEPDEELEI